MDLMPPTCPEIENTILASFFVDKEIFYRFSPDLLADMFYSSAHKELLEYMIKNTCQDSKIISERFPQHRPIIATCLSSYSTAQNLTAHIDVLKDRYNRRRIITGASQIMQRAASELDTPAKDLAGTLQELVFSILEDSQGKPVHIGQILSEVFERFDTKNTATGLSSGLVDVDEITGGFLPDEYTIIAARPSMGKSSLALNLVRNASINHKEPCLLFSVEMSRLVTTGRILCSQAEVSYDAAMRHTLPQREYPKLSLAAGPISDAPIFIDDTPAVTISQIMMRAEQFKNLHGIKLIVIDHGGFVRAIERARSKHEEITAISHAMKEICKRLHIPVVLLWQLSRSVEMRHPPIPMLSDLRESGTLEEDADKVILLYRESYYDKSKPQDGLTDVIIAKNRNGGTGSRSVYFDGPTMQFRNLEKYHEGEDNQPWYQK